MGVEEERRHLKRLIEQHTRNIHQLEEVIATYGLKVPLELANALDNERAKLEEAQARLAALEGKSTEAVALNDLCIPSSQHLDRQPFPLLLEQAKRVGLVAIHKIAQETRSSTLEEATKSYWLMGISAQYVCSAEAYRECIRKRRYCQYRFLLLNPDSDYVRELEREGTSKEVFADYIRSSIKDLKDARERFNPNIEVRLYNALPTFRIVIIDEERCYVSFYSTTPGIYTPQIVFEKAAGETSFYIPFRSLYEQYWEKATPIEEWEEGRDKAE